MNTKCFNNVKEFISLKFGVPKEKINNETELFYFSLKLLADFIDIYPEYREQIEAKINELLDFRNYQLERK